MQEFSRAYNDALPQDTVQFQQICANFADVAWMSAARALNASKRTAAKASTHHGSSVTNASSSGGGEASLIEEREEGHGAATEATKVWAMHSDVSLMESRERKEATLERERREGQGTATEATKRWSRKSEVGLRRKKESSLLSKGLSAEEADEALGESPSKVGEKRKSPTQTKNQAQHIDSPSPSSSSFHLQKEIGTRALQKWARTTLDGRLSKTPTQRAMGTDSRTHSRTRCGDKSDSDNETTRSAVKGHGGARMSPLKQVF